MPMCVKTRWAVPVLGFGLTMAALSSLCVPRSRACDYPAFSADLVSDVVAEAGPVLVELGCLGTESCERIVEGFRVVQGDQTLAGSLRDFVSDKAPQRQGFSGSWVRERRVLAWVPQTPLASGQEVQVELTDPEFPGNAVTLVVRVDGPSGSPSPPDLSAVEATLSLVGLPRGVAYCCAYTSCGPSACMTESEQREVLMTFNFDALAMPPSVLLRSRTATEGGVGESGWHLPSQLPPAVFRAPADSFCAALDALDPVTDEVRATREFCLEAPFATDTVGTVQPSILFTDDYQDAWCDRPPERNCRPDEDDCEPMSRPITRAWCDWHMSDCRLGDPSECDNSDFQLRLLSLCRPGAIGGPDAEQSDDIEQSDDVEQHDEVVEAGDPRAAGADYADGRADASAADAEAQTAEPDGDEASVRKVESCSLSGASSGGGGAWLLSALAVWLLRRRAS